MNSITLVVLVALVGSLQGGAAPLHSRSSPPRFAAGDAAYRERGTAERARSALRLYQDALKVDPKDAEAAWRVAMASHFVGMRYASLDEREDLFRAGRDAGWHSLTLSQECASCHFWTATNMALLGQEIGALKMFFSLKEIRFHLWETVRLEPDYAYGGAYRVLGLIEQRLPGILGGSNDRAKEHFEKAIASCPDEPLNYLVLARLLRDELSDPDGAAAVVKRGMAAIGSLPADRVESNDAFDELTSLLPDLTLHAQLK